MRLHLLTTLLGALDSNAMNDEEVVARRYPRAELVFFDPIQHHGDTLPCCAGEWVILKDSGEIDHELGRGPTEGSAWADAAKNIASEVEDAA